MFLFWWELEIWGNSDCSPCTDYKTRVQILILHLITLDTAVEYEQKQSTAQKLNSQSVNAQWVIASFHDTASRDAFLQNELNIRFRA